jgi:hypothetical protein
VNRSSILSKHPEHVTKLDVFGYKNAWDRGNFNFSVKLCSDFPLRIEAICGAFDGFDGGLHRFRVAVVLRFMFAVPATSNAFGQPNVSSLLYRHLQNGAVPGLAQEALKIHGDFSRSGLAQGVIRAFDTGHWLNNGWETLRPMWKRAEPSQSASPSSSASLHWAMVGMRTTPPIRA